MYVPRKNGAGCVPLIQTHVCVSLHSLPEARPPKNRGRLCVFTFHGTHGLERPYRRTAVRLNIPKNTTPEGSGQAVRLYKNYLTNHTIY